VTPDNDLGGFRDAYDWPYHWGANIHGDVLHELTHVSAWWDPSQLHNYENHWTYYWRSEGQPNDYNVDIYWSLDDVDRAWMPLDIGDNIAEFLTTERADFLNVLIWNGWRWTQAEGWVIWTGHQGDFVEHIHTEWWKEALDNK
jgi:hypothetical protein